MQILAYFEVEVLRDGSLTPRKISALADSAFWQNQRSGRINKRFVTGCLNTSIGC